MSDIYAILIVSMLGVIAFMGRRYFYRVEVRLEKNEYLLNIVTKHDLQLEDHARRIESLERRL